VVWTLNLIGGVVELSGDRLIDAVARPLALVAGVVVDFVVSFDPQAAAPNFEHKLIVRPEVLAGTRAGPLPSGLLRLIASA
jgi:hypothetical protein